MALENGTGAPNELLSTFGDDVTYWDDSGDVYGASFGQVRARESQVPAQLTNLAAGPLVGRVQASFILGGQPVVKTVTMRADDPLVEVDLDISALPETTAIVETPTILDTDHADGRSGFWRRLIMRLTTGRSSQAMSPITARSSIRSYIGVMLPRRILV